MDVQMIEKRSVPLASGATQTYPAGWSGSVPTEFGAQWVAEGAAIPLLGASAHGFTPEQHAVLAYAADQALAIAAEQQAAAESGAVDDSAAAGDDLTEELPTVSEDDISLDELTKAELLELADGIEGADKMRKSELVEAIKARQSAPAAAE